MNKLVIARSSLVAASQAADGKSAVNMWSKTLSFLVKAMLSLR